MDSSISLTRRTSIDQPSCDVNIITKLKRLKIQEEIIVQSLNHLGLKCSINSINRLDYIKYSSQLKYSYFKIKDIFEEVNVKTDTYEMLKTLDIDGIRSLIGELESNIKVLKQHLQYEIKILKTSEEDLLNQLFNDKKTYELKKKTRMKTVTYKETVSSPVKLIMNSPFKHSEVQQFQDFISKSSNRFGGWNEYHHNIFKKLWNKHMGRCNICEENKVVQSDNFNIFVEEVLKSIQGVTKECIISHSKWYVKYLNLKNLQQKAIKKWKNNRKYLQTSKNFEKEDPVKEEAQNKNTENHENLFCKEFESEIVKSSIDEMICKDFMEFNQATDKVTSNSKVRSKGSKFLVSGSRYKSLSMSTYRNDTIQWKSRCKEIHTPSDSFRNIEDIKKLRIPDWRKVLGNPCWND